VAEGEGRIRGHRLERYPFPVAFPARLAMIASDPGDILDKTSHFLELTATILSILTLAWYQKTDPDSSELQKWEKKLEPFGITLGTWIAVIGSARTELAREPNHPVARAIRLACDAAHSSLTTFNPMRNTYAHGGKPRLPGDQENAAANMSTGVSAMLDALEPLTQIRLGVVKDCQPQGTSWQASVDIMTGAAQPFPTKRMPAASPYEKEEVVAFYGSSLRSAISLTPFCTWTKCPQCGQDELFYLHQRKRRRNLYYSFSSGHERIVRGESPQRARQPVVALGMVSIGSRRSAASSGWRANWAALAPRPRRLVGRLIDLALVMLIAGVTWFICRSVHVLPWPSAGIAVGLAALYEPAAILVDGTVGKRLMRIEPISAWDARPLGGGDALRRALVADAQLLFPPLAIRNLAWMLWDPARQCLHDRVAKSIVIAGRTQRGQKI
jgi:uncharacterized RDD family membrane protein YckC